MMVTLLDFLNLHKLKPVFWSLIPLRLVSLPSVKGKMQETKNNNFINDIHT